MRIRWIFVPLVAAAALIAAYAAPHTDSTPESTIRTFLTAIEKGDVETAGTCVLGAKIDSKFDSLGALLRKEALHFDISDFKATEQGAECTATFTVSVGEGSQRQKVPGQVLNLHKVDGQWKIRSGAWPTPSEPDQSRQVESLVTMLAHPEAMDRAHESAVTTACLSNLKQLAVAVIMFMGDNNDKYLLSTAKLQTKLAPYTKNTELFHCPDKQHPDPYSFNDRLTGKKDVAVEYPSQTVMLYEGANEKLVFRHNGRAAVAFADSHVKLITPEAAKSLVWKP